MYAKGMKLPEGKQCAAFVTIDLAAEFFWISLDERAKHMPKTLSLGQYGMTHGLPRMLDLLDLIDQPTDPKKLTSDICRTYHITATKLSDVSYFESSSLSYLNYLRGLGYLEADVEDNSIHYRRTPTSYARKEAKRESVLPKTGQFR